MKSQLSAYLNRYVNFSDEEINTIFEHLLVRHLNKKDFLLSEGSISRSRFFIIEGLVRTWRLDHKGNEKILHFGIENWWVTDFESFVLEQPSLVNIQCIENSIVLELTKTNLEILYTKVPKLERAFRIITEKTLIAIERKNEFYLKLSSKERYESLVKQIPDFAQRVPQYMIASYLNISPEYLSEIRKH